MKPALLHWYQQCENPEVIESLYSSRPPLALWDLRDVMVLDDGERVRLRAVVSEFPDNPPEEWPAEFNRTQVSVDLTRVSEFNFSGWSQDNTGIFTLIRETPYQLAYSFKGRLTRVRGTCQSARISKIAGYAAQGQRAG